MLAKIYDILIILLILLGAGAIGYLYLNRHVIFKNVTETISGISVPEGFERKEVKISSKWLKDASDIRGKTLVAPSNINVILFAGGLNEPSKITLVDSLVVITEHSRGNIVVLNDIDSDNSADDKLVFDSGLRKPYGIAFYNNDLYVAEENQVIVYRNFLEQYYKRTSEYEVLIPNLPFGGENTSKSLLVGPEEKIFISIGSSCNFCVEYDKRRAAVVTYNLDGAQEEIYSTGLRNIGDLLFVRGNLYVTEESIKDPLVNDELNSIQKNHFYGWPSQVNNDELYRNSVSTFESENPKALFPHNSIPKGMEYVDGKMGLDNTLIISLFGNSDLESNKLVLYKNQSEQVEDFVMFNEIDQITANPVDIQNYGKGVLVTDSLNGLVYYIY